MIGIVTVNWNGCEMTCRLVEQFLRGEEQDFRLVVVNNSPAEAEKFAACAALRDPRVQVIHSPRNAGYSGGLNMGIRALLSDPAVRHFLLINNDVQVEAGFLRAMLARAADPNAIYAPLILQQDTDRVQNTGGMLHIWLGGALNMNKNAPLAKVRRQQPGFLSGCAVFLHRLVIERVGLFDESFGSYCEDVDYCLRAEARGVRLEILWDVYARHFHSYSTQGNPGYKVYLLNRNQILLARKHLPPLRRAVFITAAVLRGAAQNLLRGQFRAYWQGVKEGLSL